MNLAPESHYLNWLIVDDLSRLSIDSPHSNILNLAFDSLGEGDLASFSVG